MTFQEPKPAPAKVQLLKSYSRALLDTTASPVENPASNHLKMLTGDQIKISSTSRHVIFAKGQFESVPRRHQKPFLTESQKQAMMLPEILMHSYTAGA